jgi:hypothetical protein
MPTAHDFVVPYLMPAGPTLVCDSCSHGKEKESSFPEQRCFFEGLELNGYTRVSQTEAI